MKKTIKKLAPAMLVLVALATLSFMAKDSVLLRLKPQQGKTYTATTKANMMTMMATTIMSSVSDMPFFVSLDILFTAGSSFMFTRNPTSLQ